MSERTQLTDGSGRGFDRSKAIDFDERTTWNGNNHISVATGSQWGHERLYYTRSGSWVLNEWSQWQGSTETYELIDESDAIAWLLLHESNESEEFAKLPDSVRKLFEAAEEAAEV
jgi:hypothetical protein